MVRRFPSHPFQSLATPEAVRKQLGPEATWTVVQDLTCQGSRGGGTYRDTWIEVPDFRLMGVRGTLRLHFYNDRLSGTGIYLKDRQPLLQALKERGLELKRASAGHLIGRPTADVMVYADTDGWGDHVTWLETRLLSESDHWQGTYGFLTDLECTGVSASPGAAEQAIEADKAGSGQ